MGMERYRAIVRLEEIRTLLEQGEYDAAKELADSMRQQVPSREREKLTL